MLIKDKYQIVLREIMQDHSISPIRPWFGHEVPSDATFKDVVRYTDYYAGKGNDELPKHTSHYRYDRYLKSLQPLSEYSFKERKAHVDLGCGAGPFSWAFLDWASELEIGFEHICLFGLDHSEAMIRLAQEIRNRLRQTSPTYPILDYHHDVRSLLDAMIEDHQVGTDYIVTFGYLLAQAHAHEVISQFVDIILHVIAMIANKSDCFVVAVDTTTKMPHAFREGWESLLNVLRNCGAHYEPIYVPYDGVKVTRIYEGT